MNLKTIAQKSERIFQMHRAEADADTQVALDKLRANPNMSQAQAVREAHRERSWTASAEWQATA
ncbi:MULTISPECIES: hypothetical protein [Micromonospora]|uniref:Uncharacterized protein n=1 Tax=Micromonospora tulbaghiae TaxID=479978 RepID=A0A386WRC2_9ACTN|nr:hypothetical protein [Micromonospora tulbaghiae]AYF30593.1 hypothetical protein CSH63_24745 [Micromonospora tulbaghiae]